MVVEEQEIVQMVIDDYSKGNVSVSICVDTLLTRIKNSHPKLYKLLAHSNTFTMEPEEVLEILLEVMKGVNNAKST